MKSSIAILRNRRTWLVATYVVTTGAVGAVSAATSLDLALIAAGAVGLTATATAALPGRGLREQEAGAFKLAAVVPAVAFLVASLASGLVALQVIAAVAMLAAFAFAAVLIGGSHRSALARSIVPAAYSMRPATSSKGQTVPVVATVRAARGMRRVA